MSWKIVAFPPYALSVDSREHGYSTVVSPGQIDVRKAEDAFFGSGGTYKLTNMDDQQSYPFYAYMTYGGYLEGKMIGSAPMNLQYLQNNELQIVWDMENKIIAKMTVVSD